MNRYLGSTHFRELLAASIAGDETFRRAGEAVDGALKTSARSISNTLIFARLARDSGFARPVPMLPPLERLADLTGGLAALPEAVLDLLAWQLHVESYDEAVSVEARRQMVWASVMLHRKRGTPWAVRYGLETTLQVPAEISEWFDYGGEPYFFRVTLDISGVAFDARASESAIKVIFAHKNARSWLEWLKTKSTRKLPVTIGTGVIQSTFTQTFTWRWQLDFAASPIPVGLGALDRTIFAAWNFIRPTNPQPAKISGGLAARNYTRSMTCPRQPKPITTAY